MLYVLVHGTVDDIYVYPFRWECEEKPRLYQVANLLRIETTDDRYETLDLYPIDGDIPVIKPVNLHDHAPVFIPYSIIGVSSEVAR